MKTLEQLLRIKITTDDVEIEPEIKIKVIDIGSQCVHATIKVNGIPGQEFIVQGNTLTPLSKKDT